MPRTSAATAGVLSRQRVHALALIGATLLGVYLCYRLAQPFLPALAWGLALAVVAYPIHKAICRRIPHAAVAAALSVAAVAIVIIAPAAFVIHQLARQAGETVRLAREFLETGAWREAIESRPRLAPVLGWITENVAAEDLVTRAGKYLEAWGPAFVAGSVGAAVQMLITLLVLFYLFRDKRDFAEDARGFLPLSEREADTLLRRIVDTIHATIFGSLTVAAVQGFMGGLMFWLLGLPAPIVWGAVMALLATIPVAGTFVVWAPAAVYLAMTGAWGKAAVLVGWGAVAIGLIDNFLYPMLVGRRLRFHPLPVFFSIVGGLALFGAAGLVLGPIILSVTAALLELLRRRTSGGRAADAGARDVAA
ncbi:MAG TPA: AI-2E family transporter [Methylomirabilota bacterium]|jgi:predicted PurR-regulated permease PerM